MPPPPPPPGGPPPPPTFSQANTSPPKLSRDEAKGRGALLTDICKGTRLKKVAVVNDRSAPLLDKLKGGGAAAGGANGSPSGSVPQTLFTAGVPKLRPVADGSSGRSPSTRAAAPRPPSHRHDNTESPSPQALSPGANRPPPPIRDTPSRAAAPPVPVQPSAAALRSAGREAPPPPPYRTHGSPSLFSDPPQREASSPTHPHPRCSSPPPPPLRNGHSSTSSSIPRSFADDFESKYSFHPLDDFPPPEEYRHFAKIYPSKANRVMRGAPPLPPVGR
ncbi:hypothetical protein EPR50_G00164920 [Perca flavescens]|uniref:WH2 domain-containing protein n=1 Tax=Perca flavescens TaxID=8167 RepID=A0A484CNT2_PERFV|nr:hypothetical protein EPR50_G00164920 [Perca flavescens]